MSRVHDAGGAAGPHTGQVAKATAIQGHREPLPFDFRQASMVTRREAKRLRGTASMLPPVPWCPLGAYPRVYHRGVLASGTTNREGGHGDRHDRRRVELWRLMGQSL